MSSKGKVPDAWDDDWVNQADTSENASSEPAPGSKKLSKAERRAQQAEFNRRLWQDAEAQNSAYFVESRTNVPFQSSLKPNVTVLSRKPAGPIIAKKDPVTGIEQLKLQDDEDDEDQEKPKTPTPEERALKAQREREEKQKKYDEARERLFGTSTTSPGTTSPGRSNTPVRGSATERGKGRGRGGKDSKENRESRPGSAASTKSKQLFDPGYTAKPDSIYLQRKEAEESGAPPIEQQVIRMPKGPDGSGRGGHGFAERGEKNI